MSPLRGRICVERAPDDTVRIIVPPVRDWRALASGYKFAGVTLLGIVILFVLGGLRIWGSGDSEPLFINGAIYAVFLGILLTAAHQRVNRTLMFEISPAAVAITRIAPNGRRTMRRLRRGIVIAAQVPSDHDNLVVCLHARDQLEMFAGPRHIALAAARSINHALDETSSASSRHDKAYLPPPAQDVDSVPSDGL